MGPIPEFSSVIDTLFRKISIMFDRQPTHRIQTDGLFVIESLILIFINLFNFVKCSQLKAPSSSENQSKKQIQFYLYQRKISGKKLNREELSTKITMLLLSNSNNFVKSSSTQSAQISPLQIWTVRIINSWSRVVLTMIIITQLVLPNFSIAKWIAMWILTERE